MLLDPLESRTHLSANTGVAIPFRKNPSTLLPPVLGAAVTASVSKGGTLTILGTDNDDEVTIIKGTGKNYSVVSGDGGVLSFKFTSVKRICAWLGSGGDDLSLWDLPTPATIMAGAGDDLIVGTAASDTLYGGTGSDSLEGAAGDDQLLGEDGNDTLDGGRGHDTVTGGAGNDTWVASIGLDSKADLFDYEDTHGWTRIPEELPASAITLKATTTNGVTTLRVLVTVPTDSYDVQFGTASRNDSITGSQGYDASVEASLPIDVGFQGPAFQTFKKYYDLGDIAKGKYSITFRDFSQHLITTINFKA